MRERGLSEGCGRKQHAIKYANRCVEVQCFEGAGRKHAAPLDIHLPHLTKPIILLLPRSRRSCIHSIAPSSLIKCSRVVVSPGPASPRIQGVYRAGPRRKYTKPLLKYALGDGALRYTLLLGVSRVTVSSKRLPRGQRRPPEVKSTIISRKKRSDGMWMAKERSGINY